MKVFRPAIWGCWREVDGMGAMLSYKTTLSTQKTLGRRSDVRGSPELVPEGCLGVKNGNGCRIVETEVIERSNEGRRSTREIRQGLLVAN